MAAPATGAGLVRGQAFDGWMRTTVWPPDATGPQARIGSQRGTIQPVRIRSRPATARPMTPGRNRSPAHRRRYVPAAPAPPARASMWACPAHSPAPSRIEAPSATRRRCNGRAGWASPGRRVTGAPTAVPSSGVSQPGPTFRRIGGPAAADRCVASACRDRHPVYCTNGRRKGSCARSPSWVPARSAR